MLKNWPNIKSRVYQMKGLLKTPSEDAKVPSLTLLTHSMCSRPKKKTILFWIVHSIPNIFLFLHQIPFPSRVRRAFREKIIINKKDLHPYFSYRSRNLPDIATAFPPIPTRNPSICFSVSSEGCSPVVQYLIILAWVLSLPWESLTMYKSINLGYKCQPKIRIRNSCNNLKYPPHWQ